MDKNIANNKRIAKNTLFLYFRTFIIMAINLYTSRAVLDTLGVTDFGIYNVVGGFVLSFGIISNSMAASTQRFISFELGKGQDGNVKSVFSTAVIIHILLSLIVIIIAETIGIWFLNEKMNFPQDRYYAANWVFQLSLITFIIQIISVPYNAALIAFERMKAFAYVSIVEATLKLLIVFAITYTTFDKLIIYAILLALVAVSIRILYGIYVKRNIKPCVCTWEIDKSVRNNMISFAGWNTFGSMSNIANTQGINIILNLFSGAATNAARGIAMQVLNAVQQFVSNFQLAMSPQIIKTYAAGQKDEMYKIVFRGSRFSFILLMILTVPLVTETYFILNLWLVEVPSYTVVFLRIILLIALVNSLGQTLSYAMHASGKVKAYQLVVGPTYILALPVAYYVLYLGFPPYAAMIVTLIFAELSQIAQMIMLKRSISFPIIDYAIKVCLRSWVLFMISIALCFLIKKFTPNSIIFSLLNCFFCIAVTSIISITFGITKNEKHYILTKCKSTIYKIKNKNEL